MKWKRRQSPKALIFCFAGFILWLTTLAHATEPLFSNYTADGNYWCCAGSTIGGPNNLQQSSAFPFTVGTSAVFDGLKLAITHFQGPSEIAVALMDDNNGVPGTVIESFFYSGPLPFSGSAGVGSLSGNVGSSILLNSSQHPTLNAGTQYWIAVSAPTGFDGGWNQSFITTSPPPGQTLIECFALAQCWGDAVAWAVRFGSGPWTPVTPVQRSAFEISGTAIDDSTPCTMNCVLNVVKHGKGSGTVLSTRGDITCGNVCSADFDPNTKITLTAKADAGSVFIGWSESGCAPDKGCTIQLNTKIKTVEARFAVRPTAPAPKAIFIGVCGAGGFFVIECLENEGWFDPRDLLTFSGVNPLNEDDLDFVAENFSGLTSIGLRVGAEFSNSIVLIAAFSSELALARQAEAKIIVDFIEQFFDAGDLVFLAGHSNGGTVIQEVALKLDRLSIPVKMTAYIDAFPRFRTKIPVNVARAFNFYYDDRDLFCLVSGQSSIEAKDPTKTVVSNTQILDPEGPDSGSCTPHRNMDNDPLVWKPILNYILGAVPTN